MVKYCSTYVKDLQIEFRIKELANLNQLFIINSFLKNFKSANGREKFIKEKSVISNFVTFIESS